MKNLPKFSEYRDQKISKPVKESKRRIDENSGDEIQITATFTIPKEDLFNNVINGDWSVSDAIDTILEEFEQPSSVEIDDISFDNEGEEEVSYNVELIGTKENLETITGEGSKLYYSWTDHNS